MKKTIKEQMSTLDELLRTANSLINPITVHQDLKWLMNKDVRTKFKERFPKCYLSMNIGQKSMIFPICNRSGAEDPSMIDFSMKVANRLAGKPHINTEELKVILTKLTFLKKKFSKPIPKPANMAVQKGKVTKNLNQIKKLLHPER